MSSRTFEGTSTTIAAVRGTEYFQSLSYIKSFWELLDRRSRQAASEHVWKRESLPHWEVKVEAPSERAPNTPRACEVIQHTFADGSTMSRCLGVFADGRNCAFAQGHERPDFNCKKHRPEVLGAFAVGEIAPDRDETVPESDTEVLVIEGVIYESEPIEPELTDDETLSESEEVEDIQD